MGCTTSKAVDADQPDTVGTSLAEARSAMREAKMSLRRVHIEQKLQLNNLIRERNTSMRILEEMKAIDRKKIANKGLHEARISHLTRVIASADEMIAFSKKELSDQRAVINNLSMM